MVLGCPALAAEPSFGTRVPCTGPNVSFEGLEGLEVFAPGKALARLETFAIPLSLPPLQFHRGSVEDPALGSLGRLVSRLVSRLATPPYLAWDPIRRKQKSPELGFVALSNQNHC